MLSRRDFAVRRQWLAEGGTDTLLVRGDGVFSKVDYDAADEPLVICRWASWKRGVRLIEGAD